MQADLGRAPRPSPAQPRGLTRLDARLDPASPAPIALGLSGGGDSVALLTLALDWARPLGRPVLALTVDHGLQGESAAWTARAGEQARRLGAEWRSLAWTGPKPASGIAAAARRARHALLAEAARAAGASVLLLGHTADDVLEGERMRARGSTLGALRDWAPSPVWPEGRELFLFRPLLDVRRAELRARLAALGLDWIDDPANADPRSLRARVRAELGAEAEAEASSICPQWGKWSAKPTEGGEALAAAARAPLGGRSPPLPPEGGNPGMGLLAFPRDAFIGPGARVGLAIALVCASGRERLPRGAALDRLAGRLAAGESFTATLAGARIETGPETVRIFREPGEAARGGLVPIRVEPGRPRVWDGRFEVTARESGLVRAAGGLTGRLDTQDRAALKVLPPAARAGAPVLIRDSDSRPILAGRSAQVRDLVELRRITACGQIAHEREITGLRVALAV